MTAPQPGSPEWLTYITASKVPAIVGTSPYESRFSLWHRMAGNLPPVPQNDAMTRGNYLEPAILAWFRDRHPELLVEPGQWATHPDHPWAGATPDGAAWPRTPDALPGLVEAKSAMYADDWKDGPPPGYRDQCQWAMHVWGSARVYVPALVAMTFVEHVVERDQDRIDYLHTEAVKFRDSLTANAPPDIDGSTHTYQAVRELHPDIDPEDIDLDPAMASQFINARADFLTYERAWTRTRSRMADHMGTARRATWNGEPIAIRKARNGGTPWVEPARTLPKIGAHA